MTACFVPLVKRFGKYLKSLTIKDVDFKFDLKKCQELVRFATNLEILSFIKTDNIEPECFELFENLKFIKSLNLDFQYLVSQDYEESTLRGLIKCLGAWKNITELKISPFSINSPNLILFLQSVPQSVLHFGMALATDDCRKKLRDGIVVPVQQFLQSHANLESFEFFAPDSRRYIRNDSIELSVVSLLEKHCSSGLRHVGMNGEAMAKLLKVSANFPHLESIKIGKTQRYHVRIFDSGISGSGVKNLHITSEPNGILWNIRHADFVILSLTELRIDNIQYVRGSGDIESLISMIPNLDRIYISNKFFDLTFFKLVVTKCRSLKLFHCNEILPSGTEKTLVSMLQFLQEDCAITDTCLTIEIPMSNNCYRNVMNILNCRNDNQIHRPVKVRNLCQ